MAPAVSRLQGRCDERDFAWLLGRLTEGMRPFTLLIPETLVFRRGQGQAFFYTDKNGFLQARRRSALGGRGAGLIGRQAAPMKATGARICPSLRLPARIFPAPGRAPFFERSPQNAK